MEGRGLLRYHRNFIYCLVLSCPGNGVLNKLQFVRGMGDVEQAQGSSQSPTEVLSNIHFEAEMLKIFRNVKRKELEG